MYSGVVLLTARTVKPRSRKTRNNASAKAAYSPKNKGWTVAVSSTSSFAADRTAGAAVFSGCGVYPRSPGGISPLAGIASLPIVRRTMAARVDAFLDPAALAHIGEAAAGGC